MSLAAAISAAAFFVEKALPETLPGPAERGLLRAELTAALDDTARLLPVLLGDSRSPQDLAMLGLPVTADITPEGIAEELEQALAEGAALLANLHPLMPLAEEGLLRAVAIWDPAGPAQRLARLERLSVACQRAASLVHDLRLLMAQAQIGDGVDDLKPDLSSAADEAEDALQRILELNARMPFDDLAVSIGARAEQAEKIVVDRSFDPVHREALDAFGALLGHTEQQGLGSAIQRAITGKPSSIDGHSIGSPGWAGGPLRRLGTLDQMRRRWVAAEPVLPRARLDALISLRKALEVA